MPCKHCCGADQLFNLKSAKKELRKYRKKGPGKTTKRLIDLMFEDDITNNSLLDIGGGIGAVQWAFLRKGGMFAVGVDASGGYLSVARSYAEKQGFMNKVDFVKGDFVDQVDEIPVSDFVSLDKVICCYPDYKSLVFEALKKCKKSIGLTFPFGGPILKMIASLNRIYFYFKKNPFRTYIHNPKEVEKHIVDNGFELTEKTTSFPWHVQVYVRSNQ